MSQMNGERAVDTSLAQLPATGAAKRLVLERLEETERALLRLAEDRGQDALHDFRVALRRLRSTLGTYRLWLGRAAGKKLRRRFGDVADATNRGRDAEVQAAWIRSRCDAFPESSRPSVAAVAERLSRPRRLALGRLGAKVEAAAAKLRHRLSKLEERDGAFAPVLRELARRHAAEVALCLGSITGPDEVDRAHAARIAVKRLRYLVEPILRATDGHDDALVALITLQDLLGELHDAHLLENALVALRSAPDAVLLAPAIDELRRLNTDRRSAAYAELARHWLEGKSAATLEALLQRADRPLAEN